MSAGGRRFAIASAFCALAALHAAHGQRPRATIEQLDHAIWGTREGAPSYISSLAQSADGVLWIANNVGLYRFDGVHFERFEPPPAQSFPRREINELGAMPDSSLWVGFFSGGVSVIARGAVVSYTARDGIPEGKINGIARDSAGDTWVSSETGLARLHGGQWQRMGREQQYPGGNTGELLVDRRGAVWAPTPVGMFVLSRGDSQFVRQGPAPNSSEGGTPTPTEAPDGSI